MTTSRKEAIDNKIVDITVRSANVSPQNTGRNSTEGSLQFLYLLRLKNGRAILSYKASYLISFLVKTSGKPRHRQVWVTLSGGASQPRTWATDDNVPQIIYLPHQRLLTDLLITSICPLSFLNHISLPTLTWNIRGNKIKWLRNFQF